MTSTRRPTGIRSLWSRMDWPGGPLAPRPPADPTPVAPPPGPVAEFQLLTDLYEVRWSSIRFYAAMMERIRSVIEAAGHRTRSLPVLDPGPSPSDVLLLLDSATLVSLAREGWLPRILGRRYVLITGENLDPTRTVFVGWEGVRYLRDLALRPGNLLWQVLAGAERATWQNAPVRDLLHGLLPPDRVSFFPIDGYRPEHLVADAPVRDIDVLVYGGMAYPRRAELVRQLLLRGGDLRIAVASNVFDLDGLLGRARTIVHVNSVDGCDHVPYAKLMKPLANARIVFVERSAELVASDLAPFVRTFAVDDVGGLLGRIRRVLDRFEEEDAALRALDPRGWLEAHHDFDANVRRLLGL